MSYVSNMVYIHVQFSGIFSLTLKTYLFKRKNVEFQWVSLFLTEPKQVTKESAHNMQCWIIKACVLLYYCSPFFIILYLDASSSCNMFEWICNTVIGWCLSTYLCLNSAENISHLFHSGPCKTYFELLFLYKQFLFFCFSTKMHYRLLQVNNDVTLGSVHYSITCV